MWCASADGTPAAGSSSSSTRGLSASAMAISSRRCWPYGSSRTRRSATCADAHFLEQRLRFVQAAPPLRRVAQHAPREFLALGDRDRDIVASRDFAQQRVDLMGAREAAAHALLGRHRLDRACPPSWIDPRIRLEEAGQQIDEGGLARAVRADQADARARREIDIDRPAQPPARRSSCSGRERKVPGGAHARIRIACAARLRQHCGRCGRDPSGRLRGTAPSRSACRRR